MDDGVRRWENADLDKLQPKGVGVLTFIAGARRKKARAKNEEGPRMRPQIRGVVLGLTAILVGLPLIAWGYFLANMVPSGHTDFRANYAAGYMLRAGRPLYDYSAELETQNQIVSREQIALP